MVTIRLSDDLRDRIDAIRGDVPRERWVRRVLEGTLNLQKVVLADQAHLQRSSESARAFVREVSDRERRDAATVEGTPLPKIAPRRQPR